MMKRVIPLLILGGAAASSRLGVSNHVGVEEVGDQIEFFPEEFPSREELIERARKLEEMPEEGPDMSLVELAADSQRERREAVSCGSDEASVVIKLDTAAKGWQTSYIIKDSSGKSVLTMPQNGSRFGNNQSYTEETCLPSGKYILRVKDSAGDGMCANGSCGMISVKVNGSTVLNMRTQQAFSVVQKSFSVALFSGRNSFNSASSSSNGQVFKGDSGFEDKSCYDTQVYLLIDKYGKETSFDITKKGTSRSIFSKTNPLGAYEKQTFDVGCLQPGDYTITFTDIDGICCRNGEGKFKLIVDGVELFSGGRFTGQISHDFKIGYDWGQGMQSRDWEYLLAHNERRQDYHTRCTKNYCGKKYRPLKWSAGLAADAKVYAEALLDSCEDTGITHMTGIEQGENLAKNKGFGQWGDLYPADKIVKRFVDNEASWAWTKNAHLTQALWYATRYLGCAESVKTMSDGATCRMQVCRYAKAGNCEMGKYDSHNWPNHEVPMMMDDSNCGPVCPPEGCYI